MLGGSRERQGTPPQSRVQGRERHSASAPGVYWELEETGLTAPGAKAGHPHTAPPLHGPLTSSPTRSSWGACLAEGPTLPTTDLAGDTAEYGAGGEQPQPGRSRATWQGSAGYGTVTSLWRALARGCFVLMNTTQATERKPRRAAATGSLLKKRNARAGSQVVDARWLRRRPRLPDLCFSSAGGQSPGQGCRAFALKLNSEKEQGRVLQL